MRKRFLTLQKQLGVSFQNEKLLFQAFTHSSYVNEHRKMRYQDNERLEFLGDAVLELTVSQYLFEQYANMSEGELTKLRANIVCESSLVLFANELKFGDYVLLGKGEEITGGRTRPALLADVFEAFIGALYLDRGLDEVRKFLEKVVLPKIRSGIFSQVTDYKGLLQERVQRDNSGCIEYMIVAESGPAHNRFFVSRVLLNQHEIGEGKGKSKKEAEQQAAKIALDQMKEVSN